ncbi:MAG: cytochrome c biogenesis protein CcdA [Nanoarchaeota archaeon]|nr:cytochrome c biogenesis protein CcdA [Nanoarchaeota archaeon]
MKLKLLLPILIFSLLIINIASADTCAYFFYGKGCPHCGRVEPFIEYMETNDADLNIIHFEVYDNRSNLVLLEKYFDIYDVPRNKRGVPALFINDISLTGDTPILDNFPELVEKNRGISCPTLKTENNKTGIEGPSSPKEKLETLSWATIIGAAIVDSVNPCAIAVLLILLGALLATGDKKKVLKAGLAFTVSIYIIYFLFGLGLFSAIQISGLSFYFYKVIGFLAIIIGIFNIKDFFKYGAFGFVMEIPRRWRPTLKKLLGRATTPFGAFLLGFVVCFFELPCTGGPYLFILALLAEKTTQLAAIPILLIYNIFFILPLLIITLLLFYGFTNIEKAKEWKERNIRILHLITGIVMLGLGIIVVLGLV